MENMNRAEKYSLLLLAGGKSSRMGSNKAELFYEGKTFVQNLTEKAEKLGIHQIYLSGFEEKNHGEIKFRNDHCAEKSQELSHGLENLKEKQTVKQTVWDIYPDRGPLGGIHACMKKMTTPYCLILPVDVPQIPLSVLETLLNTHEWNTNKRDTNQRNSHKLNTHENKCAAAEEKELPLLLQHGDRKEHLIAVYPVTMVSFIEELIKEHPASVHGMLEKWGFECCQMELEEWQAANINTRENYQELLSKTEAGGKKEC